MGRCRKKKRHDVGWGEELIVENPVRILYVGSMYIHYPTLTGTLDRMVGGLTADDCGYGFQCASPPRSIPTVAPKDATPSKLRRPTPLGHTQIPMIGDLPTPQSLGRPMTTQERLRRHRQRAAIADDD